MCFSPSPTVDRCLNVSSTRQSYRSRYWNEPYFRALAKIEEVAKKHNLTLAEVALRWISHHSLMKREYGDAVLIGASSVKHIEEVCCCSSVALGDVPTGFCSRTSST